MKNIYMVQPNSQYGNSVYFPYAAGSLIAYSFKEDAVRSEYSFKGFVYKKTDIDAEIEKMEDPYLVGFSCYVWNYEYNKAFAAKLKKAFPDCITVFGGHQINESSDVLDTGLCDYMLLGEGEEAFRCLLLHLAGKLAVGGVPNLIYKKDGARLRTDRISQEIPERVSPYTEGYFDELVKNETLDFSVVFETNRGCPNRCAFCDWGNIKSKIRLYDLEMVKKEIDWMSENKIEYCYCADSNFGLFERDKDIVEYVIEKNRATGYPKKFQATYSKNDPQTVFRINKRLSDVGMSKGATLSFQSMTQEVLDNIYRKNMALSKFHELMSLYNQSHIPVYSEIILGLPGESYQTLRAGIEKLLECGQHMAINFFNCELLKNSIMNTPSYIEEHKIGTVRTEQHQYHVVPNDKDIKEYSEIVVSTAAMTSDMWVDCNILSVFVRTFHNLGLLQCFAIYLYYEKNIPYMDFYEALIGWAEKNPDTVCGRVYAWLNDKYRKVLTGDGSLTCHIKEFGELTWPLEEGAFLKIILEYDRFYREIKEFLKGYFDGGRLPEELFEYQRAVVKTPHSKGTVLELSYDFYSFFSHAYANEPCRLRERVHKLKLDAEEVPSDLKEFAVNTIWFGRKGGQNIISSIQYIE